VLRFLQHGVEHLADELLLRLGQAMDLLQLLLQTLTERPEELPTKRIRLMYCGEGLEPPTLAKAV
jgi:hypothetical protein